MQRIVIEKFSDISEDDALAKAMAKAYEYFTDFYEVDIQVLDVATLKGGRYHAIVEVRIKHMEMSEDHKVEALDVELKHNHNRRYYENKRLEENQFRRMIYDHFAAMGMQYFPEIPAYLKCTLTKVELLNHMMEEDFMFASHPHHHDTVHKYLPRGYNPYYAPCPEGNKEDDL